MRNLLLAAATAGAAMVAIPATADSVADFYRGKQITMIVGYAPGGGFDFFARIVARHLGRYVPGNPTMVVQNMPGASSVKAANFLYAAAPKDGTVLGALGSTLALNKLMGRPAKYSPEKFYYIGRVAAGDTVGIAWHTTGLKNVKEGPARQVVWAAGSPMGPNYMVGAALKRLAGFDLKIVKGYGGSGKMLAAMEKGEAEATSIGWAALKDRKGYLLRDKKVNVVFLMDFQRSAELPGVPTLIEAGKSETDRKVLRLLTSREVVGRSYTAPPGIPGTRGEALRAAFNAMVKDKSFLDDVAKRKIPVSPATGAELEKIVSEVMASDKQTIERLKWATAP